MPIRYVLNTLKPGVEPEDYERWLCEYDYRVAKTLPSIRSYRTSRIERPLRAETDPSWHYIERIDIRDVEQYQQDLASPAGQELIRQLYEHYCDRARHISFWAEEIAE